MFSKKRAMPIFSHILLFFNVIPKNTERFLNGGVKKADGWVSRCRVDVPARQHASRRAVRWVISIDSIRTIHCESRRSSRTLLRLAPRIFNTL